jgi:hypothetical protein
MKRKRPLPMKAQAMQYAGLMKVVPFASERLRFMSLVGAWEAGYRAGRAAARRAHNGSGDVK